MNSFPRRIWRRSPGFHCRDREGLFAMSESHLGNRPYTIEVVPETVGGSAGEGRAPWAAIVVFDGFPTEAEAKAYADRLYEHEIFGPPTGVH